MYGQQTCVLCEKEEITQRCKKCGREICRNKSTCNKAGCCVDEQSCREAQEYESQRRVARQQNFCRGCGGAVVNGVCTRCGPHDSPRLTNRRRRAAR